MQAAVIIVLLGVLAVAMAFFAVMGLAQVRRTKALARAANEMGLQFSSDDPFDVPRRYADLALISCGHSGRANNVSYGRLHGLPVRAFDFRYEIGHGTRRIARHYSVVTAEVGVELPPALIWHVEDEAVSPLLAGRPTAHVDCWACQGDAEFARQLAEACRALADYFVSAQTQGSIMLLCAPVRKGEHRRGLLMSQAAGVLREIHCRASRAG